MYLSGIADEAGSLLDVQIRATQTLGWKHIEARNMEVPGHPKGNLHDIPEPAFEIVVETLARSGFRRMERRWSSFAGTKRKPV